MCFTTTRVTTLILERHPWAGSLSKSLVKLGGSRSDHSGTALSSKAFTQVSYMASQFRLNPTIFSSRNRLQLPTQYELLTNAFTKLTEIQLNDTLINWTDMQTITASMPHLQAIEMGYNRLTRLAGDKPPKYLNSTVQFVNLDSNSCSDWIHICASLKEFNSYVAPLYPSICHCHHTT